MSRQILNTSKVGDSTTSLGSLFQYLTLTVKKVLPNVQTELPACQFVPIASGPVMVTTEKNLAPSSLHPPFRYSHTLMRPPDLSLLQAERSQLSQSSLMGDMLQSFHHLRDPLLDSLLQLLSWEAQN